MGDHEVRYGNKSKGSLLLIVLGVIFLIVVVLLIVFIALYAVEKNKDKGSPREVLRNEVYVREAGRMMNMMNVSVDPCEDFYEYACGSFNKYTPLPPGQIVWNLFYKLFSEVYTDLKPLVSASVQNNDLLSIKKVKWTYQACMDQAEIGKFGPQPILDLLNSLGGWPVLDPNWNDRGLNLEKLIADITLLGIDGIVTFEIGANQTRSSQSVLTLKPPTISLASKLVSSDPADVAAVESYEALAWRIAKLLDPTSRVPEQHLNDSISALIDFERQLAQPTLAQPLTGQVSIAELDAQAQTLWTWSGLINAYMRGGGYASTPLQSIMLQNIEYFSNMTSILQGVSNKTIVNWLLWNVVSTLSAELSPDFVTASNEISALSQPFIDTPRWKSCVMTPNKYLKRATSRMYVDVYFDDLTKNDVTTMGQDLRTAFKQIIEEASWMDDSTRKSALEKLAAMDIMVGYSEEIMNDTLIQENYQAVDVTITTHFTNVINLRKNAVNLPIMEFDMERDRKEWYYQATEVNAAHYLSKNHVEICAAILRPRAYDYAYPKFMNYGGIGVFIGHELTHGFDNVGRLFDKNGNILDWWSAASLGAFNKGAQCLVKQYSGFKYPQYGGISLDGNKTLTENIADNGGLKESFKAYQSWSGRNGEEPAMPGFDHMSNDQMFFLSWGQFWCEVNTESFIKYSLTDDTHSTSKYRVIGPLQNSQDFAKAYNCPMGSYMNPADKCTVW